MPYELKFTKYAESPPDQAELIKRLLPALQQRYGDDVRSDDGYIRFDDGDVALAVEIFAAENPGVFRIEITSSIRRFAVLKRIEDVPELEELKRIVAGEIAEWTGKLPDVSPV